MVFTMRLEHIDPLVGKGWSLGPWDSDLPVSVGYANQGIDEPHVHGRVTEIYLVAHGTSVIRIEETSITLVPGDILVVEPGEAHTFLESSPDYLHFVIHVPGLTGEAARTDKSPVSRGRLGLPDDRSG